VAVRAHLVVDLLGVDASTVAWISLTGMLGSKMVTFGPRSGANGAAVAMPVLVLSKRATQSRTRRRIVTRMDPAGGSGLVGLRDRAATVSGAQEVGEPLQV
jgi:hypothetical protein